MIAFVLLARYDRDPPPPPLKRGEPEEKIGVKRGKPSKSPFLRGI